MIKNLLIAFSFILLAFPLGAQVNVTLSINHKLADADFELNQSAKNNLDHNFNVTRLEYYISKIFLVHDSGSETEIEDLHILVSADTQTQVDLGDYDISTVEKIKLHIGVDRNHNHLDPASFPSTHALAPKFPSMHWGWDPGYRFVAMEGKGGSALNQLFQLHGLGDDNYLTTEVEVNATAENNFLRIALDADYTKALQDISVNNGVVVHGDNLQAKQCLENFRDYVFSEGLFTSNTIDFSEVNNFVISPNPVVNGIATISLELDHNNSNYDLRVSSLDGRQLQYLNKISDNQQIDLSGFTTGIYLVNLIKEGESIITNKIVVK